MRDSGGRYSWLVPLNTSDCSPAPRPRGWEEEEEGGERWGKEGLGRERKPSGEERGDTSPLSLIATETVSSSKSSCSCSLSSWCS